MTMYYSSDKKCFDGISNAQLIEALNDPRLPESFEVTLTHGYPGLAIISDDESRGYLGYIDLFDGEVVLYPEPGMPDGKNPFRHGDLRIVPSRSDISV